jgi:hypothetical protein
MTHQLTVAELIAYLQTLPGDAVVEHAAAGSCGYSATTGFEKSMVYGDEHIEHLASYTDGLFYWNEKKILQIGQD